MCDKKCLAPGELGEVVCTALEKGGVGAPNPKQGGWLGDAGQWPLCLDPGQSSGRQVLNSWACRRVWQSWSFRAPSR